MPKPCRYYVQHVWKKDICANCFEPREEHKKPNLRPNLKVCTVENPGKLKSILRDRQNIKVSESQRRSVVFRDSLFEIIGFGGDDDVSDTDEEDESPQNDSDDSDKSKRADEIIETEEEKKLIKITRINTNFNKSSSLINSSKSNTDLDSSTTSLDTLVLGNSHVDAEGKKTTLLITVTPFGANRIAPTIGKSVAKKSVDNKIINLSTTNVSQVSTKEKIIDMPLIQSSKYISTAEKTDKASLSLITQPSFLKTNTAVTEIPKNSQKNCNQMSSCAKSNFNRTTEANTASFDNSVNKSALIENKEDITVLGLKERMIDGESMTSEAIDDNYDHHLLVHKSREDAGAPDGRADEDEVVEPNVLPTSLLTTSGPPLKNTVNLAGNIENKINQLPIHYELISIDQKETSHVMPSKDQQNTQQSKEIHEEAIKSSPAIIKKISSTVEPENRRRMAPKPPEIPIDDTNNSLFIRRSSPNIKSNSPVMRQKEKRERATTDKKTFPFTDEDCEGAISLTELSSPSCSFVSTTNIFEEEMKKKNKCRFSLKRFLRMGSKKDMEVMPAGIFDDTIENVSYISHIKTRPEIIHPLELDGAAVEVLRHDKLIPTPEEQLAVCADVKNSSQTVTARLGKPPPPPRNSQMQKNNGGPSQSTKTTRAPLAPKHTDSSASNDPADQSWQSSGQNLPGCDSIYANLAAEDVAGEVRSGLAPSKPQRTASLRDIQPQTVTSITLKHGLSLKHERINNSDTTTSADLESYDSVNAVDNNMNNKPYYYRQSHVFSRSSTMLSHSVSELTGLSLDGCGITHVEKSRGDGATTDTCRNDIHELSPTRQKRGRHTVHRSLEDNYGAVIIANHESLAQLLEQLTNTDQSIYPTNLHILKTANLCLSQFNIDEDSTKIIGKRTFYSATWREHKVTLCLSLDSFMSLITARDYLVAPIVEFIDSDSTNFDNREDVTVTVLRRLEVNTIMLFSANEKIPNNNENSYRHCCLILLQLINALKNLQARGIEEFSKSLVNALLFKEEKDCNYRLYLLQSLYMDVSENCDDYRSLCQCALVAFHDLGLMNKLPVIGELLIRERAVSLSQVKAVLEYALWGPSDMSLGNWKEREIILQRWLDLERANVLHTLVRNRTNNLLSVANEYHVTFLVHTTAKIMCEASILLDEQRSMSKKNSRILLDKL